MEWLIEAASLVIFILLLVPTLIGFLLFLGSGITLFIWFGAWKELIVSGTGISWLFLACGYLWASVVWGEPYLRWYLALIGRS